MTTATDQWVPVTADLPDDDITVLITDATGEVWVGYRDEGRWRSAEGNVTTVTAWMDLPEPYSA